VGSEKKSRGVRLHFEGIPACATLVPLGRTFASTTKSHESLTGSAQGLGKIVCAHSARTARSQCALELLRFDERRSGFGPGPAQIDGRKPRGATQCSVRELRRPDLFIDDPVSPAQRKTRTRTTARTNRIRLQRFRYECRTSSPQVSKQEASLFHDVSPQKKAPHRSQEAGAFARRC
jgi:hypothetical protein